MIVFEKRKKFKFLDVIIVYEMRVVWRFVIYLFVNVFVFMFGVVYILNYIFLDLNDRLC